ncbi:hypothetical protein [Amorphus orientalis]|uniref:Uncharacterized protein n=1 Tax=Amorphus orientalis TaxID=649198 RepID=A0AAE3VMH4_9HYPH|nr:hypothetical protein [Amorphus orientalis]MDQ0314839.1 hypothetical protein [Amorphus orientalis]
MDDTASHVMVTPGEVAERDGVSKQAVTKIVRQLVDKHDLPVERDGRDRIARFSLAHYDHHRGQFASSARTTAARGSAAGGKETAAANSDSRDEALRREAWLRLDRAVLQQQEELKKLVRADKLQEGLSGAGRKIQSVVARLPNRADDMALAVSREGSQGLRTLLRTIAAEINREIADELDALARAAPVNDDRIADESEDTAA